MNKTATVLSCENGQATVVIVRDSACGGNCASCKLCPAQNMQLTIPTTLKLKPGEKVQLESRTSFVLFAAFLTYIFPLLLLLAGCVLGGAAIGVLCFLFSFIPLYFLNRVYSKKMDVQIRKTTE